MTPPARPFLSTQYARAALARGPLVRDWQHWRFGNRLFASRTVRRLLDAGEAVRKGNEVRIAQEGSRG